MSMTQSQQDETIGRLVRERKQAQDEVAVLRTKARQTADLLEAVAEKLRSAPGMVAMVTAEFDLVSIKALAAELDEKESRLRQLNEELKAVGL